MTHFKSSEERAVVLLVSFLYVMVVQTPGRITELFLSMSSGLNCGEPQRTSPLVLLKFFPPLWVLHEQRGSQRDFSLRRQHDVIVKSVGCST